MGSSKDEKVLTELTSLAKEEINKITGQQNLEFSYSEDEKFLLNLKEGIKKVYVNGPDLLLGKLFNEIGYDLIPNPLFKELVITRLIHPGSKLKTSQYLQDYKGIDVNETTIYRYMDTFQAHYKDLSINLTYEHTKKILNNDISLSFYDLTTLYFETEDEDDLRKLGFSKDGKAQNPQILLAMLVSVHGYPLAYEVFEGDTFEGHTLIPVIKAFKKKYNLQTLTVVADAGLLSSENIKEFIILGYPFILGARLKNENATTQKDILSHDYTSSPNHIIQKSKDVRLIVNYSEKRAKKDAHTRKKGITRLEADIKKGKLTKEKVNNRGYNKYLTIKNDIKVEINYELFKEDARWNGLKGYITNSHLSTDEVLENYKQLWSVEKAFRISKTDLRVRPIYHRVERRIRTHICLAFCSYKIYKELERQLKEKNLIYSAEYVIKKLKTVYQAQVMMPESKKKITINLPLDEEQLLILRAWNLDDQE
jgi:transposase